MKKIVIFALLSLMIVGGLLTAYMYFDSKNTSDYSGGMFVDKGEKHEYAKLYHLCEGI